VQGVSEIDFPAFDADNHYYEALDAFTRYVDPKMASRCVQWCEMGGRKYHVIGGKVSHAVVNVTFDPIAKAGAMYEYFRGNPHGRTPEDFLRDREPIPDYYRERDSRIALMDRQGLDKIWMFPTVGVLYEELLKNDIPALCHTFTAFNRWVHDDWGCNYKDRIFAAPYITLADRDNACKELEWALDHDARLVAMRPAAPTTVDGQMSPFHTYFDPFWARVNEAGITVAVHAGDSGYHTQGYADERFEALSKGSFRPSIQQFRLERAAHDFLITTVFDRLFVRFPNIRLASVENGSAYLETLFRRVESIQHKMPGYFTGHDPIEIFKQHVWINPFWEDDSYRVVELMGADRVIFGSDWPHVEGMPQPLDYAKEVKELDDTSQRLVLHDNTDQLTIRQPA
jgi:predicted TIM-barrel fold metal-dependent hydrolase